MSEPTYTYTPYDGALSAYGRVTVRVGESWRDEAAKRLDDMCALAPPGEGFTIDRSPSRVWGKVAG
jgi:hypothetical protein